MATTTHASKDSSLGGRIVVAALCPESYLLLSNMNAGRLGCIEQAAHVTFQDLWSRGVKGNEPLYRGNDCSYSEHIRHIPPCPS